MQVDMEVRCILALGLGICPDRSEMVVLNTITLFKGLCHLFLHEFLGLVCLKKAKQSSMSSSQLHTDTDLFQWKT